MLAGAHISVVEDNAPLAQNIASLLRNAGARVDIFTSGEALLAAPDVIEHLDCVLLDINLPGMSGVDVLHALKRFELKPTVLVITGAGGVAVAVEAMKLGAADFIEKPYSPSGLLETVRRSCGQTRAKREDQASARKAAAMIRSLTTRERQVLERMVDGKPNKLIAYDLGLSTRTVESYRAQLLQKLGAQSTVEAVRLAMTASPSLGPAEDEPEPEASAA